MVAREFDYEICAADIIMASGFVRTTGRTYGRTVPQVQKADEPPCQSGRSTYEGRGNRASLQYIIVGQVDLGLRSSAAVKREGRDCQGILCVRPVRH